MKVLVTGANGFLGRAVIQKLVLLGCDVYGLSQAGKRPRLDSKGVTWATGNLFAVSEIAPLMKKYKFEGLIHLAWDTTHGCYWQSNDNLKWVSASLLLFELFREYGGKRIIIAGSSAEYQWGVDSIIDENTTKSIPSSLYGISKYALRSMLSSWAPQNNISWGWGCIFNIFGPYEKKERLIPKCILTLLRKEVLTFDDGLLFRDFMHVNDAAAAFAALFRSDVEGVVNIASGQKNSVRNIVRTIANLLDASDLIKFGVISRSNCEPDTIVASISRLKEEVGWTNEISICDRLASTCEWWKERSV